MSEEQPVRVIGYAIDLINGDRGRFGHTIFRECFNCEREVGLRPEMASAFERYKKIEVVCLDCAKRLGIIGSKPPTITPEVAEVLNARRAEEGKSPLSCEVWQEMLEVLISKLGNEAFISDPNKVIPPGGDW